MSIRPTIAAASIAALSLSLFATPAVASTVDEDDVATQASPLASGRLLDLVGTGDRGSSAIGAGTDEFGVTMLYPTAPGGEAWSLAEDPTSDPRFDPQNDLERNEDGSWKMLSDKVRMNVTTSTGYDRGALVVDHGELATRGYMQAPNDWRNVEITGYVKVNEADDVDNFSWYARGGRHNDENPCEGSAYKGGLYFNGTVRVQKESWHVSYEQSPYETATDSIVGRWIGFKTVIYDVETPNGPGVRVELWIDEAADGTSWLKVYDFVDDGTMGGDHERCGGVEGMPITWGGPTATFRWDGASDVDFKWLSIREIAVGEAP